MSNAADSQRNCIMDAPLDTDTQTTRNYTESDLRKIYDEIRIASFENIFHNTELIFKDIGVFGYASPFVLDIFINIDEINKYNWPEDAVRGLFAHELSHMVSYKRRSFIGRMWFIRLYPFSESFRSRVEQEADEIAIERGYGMDLIQERIYQLRIDDKERLEKEKRIYLSPKALRILLNDD